MPIGFSSGKYLAFYIFFFAIGENREIKGKHFLF